MDYFAVLAKIMPAPMAGKGAGLLNALTPPDRQWVQTKARALARSGVSNSVSLQSEIGQRFCSKDQWLSAQQAIINAIYCAVLLEAMVELSGPTLDQGVIARRSQLSDTLGKIMERYDASAKNVIQSMRG